MQLILWVAFALAAIFEVGGNAVIRMGIKNNNIILMFSGAAALGGYGLIVNSIDWDFSKVFGVYVGVFALFGVLFGKFLFREQVQLTTWLGVRGHHCRRTNYSAWIKSVLNSRLGAPLVQRWDMAQTPAPRDREPIKKQRHKRRGRLLRASSFVRRSPDYGVQVGAPWS
jgi:small multidrug resistance family-3 protein